MSKWSVEDLDAEIEKLAQAREVALRDDPGERQARDRERAWLLGLAIVKAGEIDIIIRSLESVLGALEQVAAKGAAGDNDRMWLFMRDWLEADGHTLDDDYPAV